MNTRPDEISRGARHTSEMHVPERGVTSRDPPKILRRAVRCGRGSHSLREKKWGLTFDVNSPVHLWNWLLRLLRVNSGVNKWVCAQRWNATPRPIHDRAFILMWKRPRKSHKLTLSDKKFLPSRFAKVNSRTNPSTHPLSLLLKRIRWRIRAGIDFCKTTF